MILLILLILFEGSVLATKLLAPDSKYAHISDAIVEKVMDLVSKDKTPADTTDTGDDAVIDDSSVDALTLRSARDPCTCGALRRCRSDRPARPC